jgi:hypothetical protein
VRAFAAHFAGIAADEAQLAAAALQDVIETPYLEQRRSSPGSERRS